MSHGAPFQVERDEVKARILAALPESPEYAKTYDEIQALLQPQAGLTLVKELTNELVGEKKVRPIGKGVKGDKYRFWKADSVSDTPPVFKATEKETTDPEDSTTPQANDDNGEWKNPLAESPV